MYLHQKQVWKGEWFLPNQDNLRLAGELMYDPCEGIRLNVHGNFGDDFIVGDTTNHEIIIGLVEGSKYITLCNTFMISSGKCVFKKGHETYLPDSTYLVNYFFENLRAESLHDCCFDSALVHFNNLAEWVGISGFAMPNGEQLRADYQNNKINITYQVPSPIELCRFKNDMSVDVTFTATTPGWSSVTVEQTVQQTTLVNFKNVNPIEIERWHYWIENLGAFLSLVCYKNIYVDSLKFQKNGVYDIKFYAQRTNLTNENIKQPFQMVLTYQDIQNDIKNILVNWYKLCDDLGDVLWLLIDQFNYKSSSNVNSFLNLAQAAESFHSKKYNHPKEDPTIHKEKIKKILDLLPEEYKDYVKNKIDYNALVLSERIDELLDICGKDIYSQFIEDRDVFVKQLKDSRNYYTHYDDNGKKNIQVGSGLLLLTTNIHKLLICIVLLEVGVDKEKIKQQLIRMK